MTANSNSTARSLAAHVSARDGLIVGRTAEERRFERLTGDVVNAINRAETERDPNYVPIIVRAWSCTEGLVALRGDRDTTLCDPSAVEPAAAITGTSTSGVRALVILRDFHHYLDPNTADGPQVLRLLRDHCRAVREDGNASVVQYLLLCPEVTLPADLAREAAILDLPLPTPEELGAKLDAELLDVPESLRPTNGDREALIEAARGLTEHEAADAWARSLVTTGTLDPVVVAREKDRLIANSAGLRPIEVDRTRADVGGLDLLLSDVEQACSAYKPAARKFGVTPPKGCVLVGPPGTGKSLMAKVVADTLGSRLIEWDINAAKGKYVGQSEQQLRADLDTLSALGRVVVWIDEVEKVLAGSSTGSAETDGGISSDYLRVLLTWMAEQSGAYVLATANDASALPRELLRVGRFDGIWYVDLPPERDRVAILAVHLRQRDRDPEQFDLVTLAARTDGFSGAELEGLVEQALRAAYHAGAPDLTDAHLLAAARGIKPQSKARSTAMARLQEWAAENAKPASSAQESAAKGKGKGRLAGLGG